MTKLEHLKQLCEGATKGPWEIRSDFIGPLRIVSGEDDIAHVGAETFAVCANNSEFIAQSRNELPALLALVEQMHLCLSNMLDDGDKTDRAQAREAIDNYHKWNKGDERYE